MIIKAVSNGIAERKDEGLGLGRLERNGSYWS